MNRFQILKLTDEQRMRLDLINQAKKDLGTQGYMAQTVNWDSEGNARPGQVLNTPVNHRRWLRDHPEMEALGFYGVDPGNSSGIRERIQEEQRIRERIYWEENRNSIERTARAHPQIIEIEGHAVRWEEATERQRREWIYRDLERRAGMQNDPARAYDIINNRWIQ